MAISISRDHLHRFEEIKRTLNILGAKESSFVKVELLFFEALSISRMYGEDAHENPLLAQLKQLQQDQYQKTKEATKKVSQREQHIRKFVVGLKRALSVPRPLLTPSLIA